MTPYKDWGPSSPLAIALEVDERAFEHRLFTDMSRLLYGRQHFKNEYRVPVHVLRRRATYGGKKGRAAVKRLKAMKLRPVYMQLVCKAPMYNMRLTLE